MALKARVWSAGKLFVLGIALLATYLIFFAAAMRVSLRARDVPVPDLTGQHVNEASSLLGEAGLALRVEDGQRIDPVIEAGRIATQDPPPGITTRRQRSVKVWLSAGPRVTIIPALVGETERSAQIRLQQDELVLVAQSEIRSSRYPVGAVIAQEPLPNREGTSVAVLVNRGEQGDSYVMPDLIGVDGERAAEILRARGFRVSVVSDHPYPGVPPGVVIRQYPPAGFQIAPGEPISLEVSR